LGDDEVLGSGGSFSDLDIRYGLRCVAVFGRGQGVGAFRQTAAVGSISGCVDVLGVTGAVIGKDLCAFNRRGSISRDLAFQGAHRAHSGSHINCSQGVNFAPTRCIVREVAGCVGRAVLVDHVNCRTLDDRFCGGIIADKAGGCLPDEGDQTGHMRSGHGRARPAIFI